MNWSDPKGFESGLESLCSQSNQVASVVLELIKNSQRWEKRCRDAEEKKAELESKNSELSRRSDSASSEQHQQQQQQSSAQTEKILELEMLLQSHKVELDQISAKLLQATSSAEASVSENEKLKNRIKELEEITASAKGVEVEVAKWRALHAKAQKDYNETKEKHNEAVKQLATATEQDVKKGEDIQKLNAELDAAKQEIAKLKEGQGRATATLRKFQEKIKELKEENTALNEKLVAATTAVSNEVSNEPEGEEQQQQQPEEVNLESANELSQWEDVEKEMDSSITDKRQREEDAAEDSSAPKRIVSLKPKENQ